MNDSDATQLLAIPEWRDPRVHLLDDLWLLTIFGVVFATAVPWLLSGLSIDFIAAAAALMILGGIHVVLAVLAGRRAGRRRPRALGALQALGVLTLAFLWQRVGGLQNPAFLTVFALPIVGSIFLSRWHPYSMAALSVAAVGFIAGIAAPELRWYAPGLDVVAGALERLLGSEGFTRAAPFAGFYAPSDYYIVLLEVFAILMLACAVAADYLGTVYERLHAQVAGALIEAERGQHLWSAVLEQFPFPALIVDADTSEVRFASAMALDRFGGGEGRELGRSLFEVLNFSYPELVHDLTSGTGGVARPCMLRLRGRLVATEIRVRHLAQKGRRLALVVIQDVSDSFCVKMALDAAEHAALVVDAQGRLLAWNKPAITLFPEAAVDADVARVLPQVAPETRWWDPGLSGRRRMHVTVMQRVYQLTCSGMALPGEDERFFVLAFVPAAQSAAGEQQGTIVTTLVGRP